MSLLGAHVSVAGGLHNAFVNGDCIGAEVIQIFGASPRQWQAKIPSRYEIEVFKQAWEKSKVKKVYLHASYLVNLASTVAQSREKSIESLSAHLKIAAALGADGLIFHMGSSKGSTREQAIAHTIEGMKHVLDNVEASAYLIMENSAGGGDKLGANVDELALIAAEVNSPRVKVCFDTAHAFEAGVIEKFTTTEISRVMHEWQKKLGQAKIIALHVNDSKTIFNSHHDRHENLGEGFIGLPAFANLTKEPLLQECAWILEVPGFDGNGPDAENMNILRRLFN